ncbi:PH domain-containing protein [Demequina sp. NBRC 110057]|uniref:PH domain-containing protein n=1 Tax=Demequina sp. NBRC 110057 TaxID=1570346 RepID=UPI000A03A7BA|nr:PH domain-containing protein [Demequina sp. NBRC 110057]
MIDFSNGTFVKLRQITPEAADAGYSAILLDDEQIYLAFKGMRDGVVFTSKRIISRNVQGLTGSKQDFTSMPYSKIQTWSVETAGTFDRDAELELYFSSIGKVKFEFAGDVNIAYISKLIAHYALR